MSDQAHFIARAEAAEEKIKELTKLAEEATGKTGESGGLGEFKDHFTQKLQGLRTAIEADHAQFKQEKAELEKEAGRLRYRVNILTRELSEKLGGPVPESIFKGEENAPPVKIHATPAPSKAEAEGKPAEAHKAKESKPAQKKEDKPKEAKPKEEKPKEEKPKGEAKEGQKGKAKGKEEPKADKAAEPKAAEPKAAEPKAAEPKAAEPKAAEPKAAEPKAEPKGKAKAEPKGDAEGAKKEPKEAGKAKEKKEAPKKDAAKPDEAAAPKGDRKPSERKPSEKASERKPSEKAPAEASEADAGKKEQGKKGKGGGETPAEASEADAGKKEQGKKGKGGGEKGDKAPAKKEAAQKERKASEKADAGQKERKQSEKAEAAPAGLDDKAVKAAIKEGGKKAQDCCGMSTFGTHFFTVTIESANGNLKLLEKVLDAMNVAVDESADERKGGAGDLGKILINANDDKLVVICHTPDEVLEKATAKEWMAAVVKATGVKIVSETQNLIKAELDNDPDKDIFVFKRRDQGVSASVEFLRSRQLLPADDSDDDVDYTANSGINLNAGPGQKDY